MERWKPKLEPTGDRMKDVQSPGLPEGPGDWRMFNVGNVYQQILAAREKMSGEARIGPDGELHGCVVRINGRVCHIRERQKSET